MTARLGMGVEFSFLVGGFFGLVVDVVIFFYLGSFLTCLILVLYSDIPRYLGGVKLIKSLS